MAQSANKAFGSIRPQQHAARDSELFLRGNHWIGRCMKFHTCLLHYTVHSGVTIVYCHSAIATPITNGKSYKV